MSNPWEVDKNSLIIRTCEDLLEVTLALFSHLRSMFFFKSIFGVSLTTQVHAINILKALYQDTSLGCAVLQYASQGTVMAVTGFASSSWAVRNASMQLFGKRANNSITGSL